MREQAVQLNGRPQALVFERVSLASAFNDWSMYPKIDHKPSEFPVCRDFRPLVVSLSEWTTRKINEVFNVSERARTGTFQGKASILFEGSRYSKEALAGKIADRKAHAEAWTRAKNRGVRDLLRSQRSIRAGVERERRVETDKLSRPDTFQFKPRSVT